MNILIIEDNEILGQWLKKSFQDSNFANIINILTSFDEFLNHSCIKSYDIILIDVCLWKWNNRQWIDILKHIRTTNLQVPIIMISSHWEYNFLENAFRLWAHDYIIKPFRNKELQIRIERWFRNYIFFEYFTTKKILTYGNLVYYLDKKEFFIRDKKIILSRWSKYILLLFLIHKEKLLTQDFLISKIWGCDEYGDKNLRIKILRLKNQLETVWLASWIDTVRGEWYIFQEKISD